MLRPFLLCLILLFVSCNQETPAERFERRIDKRAPEAQDRLEELKKKVNTEAQQLQERVEQEAKEDNS